MNLKRTALRRLFCCWACPSLSVQNNWTLGSADLLGLPASDCRVPLSVGTVGLCGRSSGAESDKAAEVVGQIGHADRHLPPGDAVSAQED